MRLETPSEYRTIAVPTVVGGVPKLSTIPLIDTGMAEMAKESSTWPRAMMTIGTQEARPSAAALAGGLACIVLAILLLPRRFGGVDRAGPVVWQPGPREDRRQRQAREHEEGGPERPDPFPRVDPQHFG